MNFYLESLKFGAELQQELPLPRPRRKKIEYRSRAKGFKTISGVPSELKNTKLKKSTSMDSDVTESCVAALRSLDVALEAELEEEEEGKNHEDNVSLYMGGVSCRRRYSKESLYDCT